jgi:acetyltransferase-like isoleucine patch superfamily enzyme
MSITNSAVTTAAHAIYTSSGNSATTVMHFCNYANNNVTANVWIVPNGQTLNNNNMIYSNVTLTNNNTLVVDTEKLILGNNDAIYANCSANLCVGVTVSYIGI